MTQSRIFCMALKALKAEFVPSLCLTYPQPHALEMSAAISFFIMC